MSTSTPTTTFPARSSHARTSDGQSPSSRAPVRRHAEPQHLNESAVRRGVAAIGLAGIALIHVLDLPGKLQETPYLGVAYLGLIVTALIVAEALVRRDTALVWLAAAGIALATMGGYVVNRTLGMPGATGDIGNWLEPLGLASLFVEGVVAMLAVTGLVRRRRG
jgi:hypothetical protein